MHEFSMATQIIDKALEIAKEKKAKKVKSIEISVGELILLGEDQLEFWLKEILNKKKITKDAKIKINPVKALVKCNKCGYTGNLKPDSKHDHHSHPVFSCPNCGDSALDIKEGRDCVIKRVQVEI